MSVRENQVVIHSVDCAPDPQYASLSSHYPVGTTVRPVGLY